MKHLRKTSTKLMLALACSATTVTWSACSPEDNAASGGIGDGGASVVDAGSGLDPRPRGFAVTSGDYSVISVGVLDSKGKVLKRELLHSGSASAGLVTALSGDVVFPTRSEDPGVLVLLDRFRTDVITRIDLASGEVLGQVKTHTPNAQGSDVYSSNPQDYVRIDDATAWISRYEPNSTAGAEDPGADLLRIDPTAFERGTDRIDFSRWNSQGVRTNPDTGETETVTVYARPSGMLRLKDFLVVAVETFSTGYDAAGKGLVALVDFEEQRVTQMLELDELTGCGGVAVVPDDDTRVAVGCTGFYRDDPRNGAGLVMLKLEDDELAVEHAWRAKDDASSALTMYGVQPISTTQVLATAAGETDEGTTDTLYLVDLVSGEQEKVLTAAGNFVLGGAEYEPRSRLILVPDASTDDQGKPTAGVHLLELGEDGSIDELGITKVNDILPARSVRALY